MLSERELKDMVDQRINEAYILDHRNHSVEYHSDWKDRIDKADRLARGQITVQNPDGTASEETEPLVMNIVDANLRDYARLTSEVAPASRSYAKDDSVAGKKAALVRESIFDTYAIVNEWDTLLTPMLTMDLALCGGAFVSVLPQEDSDYPVHFRIDPRAAYPDLYNGKLQDLLTVHRFKLRVAMRLFPNLGLEGYNPNRYEDVEIVDHYGPHGNLKAVLCHPKTGKASKGDVTIVDHWEHGFGKPLVGFAQMDSHDRAFRGMFDQIKGSFTTKNRIVKGLLDYSDQWIYAPFVEKGVLNLEDKPGPRTIYHLDPNTPEARMERVQPANSNPQLFGILEFLDTQERAQTAYPESRQGEVSQSIASAAFVASTQGERTSVVRDLQAKLAKLRKETNEFSAMVDEKFLNREKALMRPVEGQGTYKPKKDIDGAYFNRVIYGAGAGLDRLNADVRVLQHKGAGLISDETARDQIDYLSDPAGEKDRIEREQTGKILAQKFLAEAPVEAVADVFILQGKGKSLLEAITVMREKQEKLTQEAQQAQAAQAESISGALPPDAAAQEQLAIEKGATRLAPKDVEQAALPPLEQIIVRTLGG